MLLSCPLIVKNEAHRLAACLESLRPVADEILVLDTGSTDDTLEVARKHADWAERSTRWTSATPADEFHFAEARNEVLSRCRGEWVLSIDADETIEAAKFTQPTFREWIARSESGQHRICLQHDDLHPERVAYVPRLFLHAGAKWVGRYHDVPMPWSEEATIVPRDVLVIHNAGLDPEKLKRNLTLLKREMAERNRVDETVLRLADTYRGLRMHAEAIGCYQVYRSCCDGTLGEYEPYIIFSMADCAQRLGAMLLALDLGRELIRRFARYERGWLVLAQVYERAGQYDLALAHYRRALDVTRPLAVHPQFEHPINREGVRERINICLEACEC